MDTLRTTCIHDISTILDLYNRLLKIGSLEAIDCDHLISTWNYDKSLVNEIIAYINSTAHKQSIIRQMDYKFRANSVEKIMLPDTDLLNVLEGSPYGGLLEDDLRLNIEELEKVLSSYDIKGYVKEIGKGPAVTRVLISLEESTRKTKLWRFFEDIRERMDLLDIRMEAPVKEGSTFALEIPNKSLQTVSLRDALESEEFRNSSVTSFIVGKDVNNRIVIHDIAKLSNILIAGNTGSGKTMFLHSLIMSLLFKAIPDEIGLLLIDTGVVDLAVYNGIPYLITPVVYEPRKAILSLEKIVSEIISRYEALIQFNAKDIASYNEKISLQFTTGTTPETQWKMKRLIIVIDDLHDLMMYGSREVEYCISLIAQTGKAVGVSVVVVTNHPNTSVITQTIDLSLSSRIAFCVSFEVDSQTILNTKGSGWTKDGADMLLGNGDMLYFSQNTDAPMRIQGVYVSDEEIERVVTYLKDQDL